MDRNDTIAAVATAPGRAGVAVVRVSGPDAFSVAAKVAGRCEGRPGGAPSVRRARFLSPVDGKTVDDGLLLAFPAPRSYTGEDVVELQCHGGAVSPRRVLAACLAAGARMAERGEFTERALENGKIDYTAASGVADIVDALTDRAADAAMEKLSGRAAAAGRELYDEALGISATLEHALDVSEDELPRGFMSGVRESLAALLARTKKAAAAAKEGAMLRDGAVVVLAGHPNVGKSSLFNALLGEGRAIVSPTPGTTRDSIEAWADFSGWPVRLVDTAGVRDTADPVEAEGVSRALGLARSCDVLLDLREGGEGGLDGEIDRQAKNRIVVYTKCDIFAACGETPPDGAIRTSSATGEGVEALRSAIVAALEARASECDAPHGDYGCERLCEAMESIERAIAAEDPVVAANAARDAASRLGSAIGAEYSRDMLETLFSRSCVGK